MHRQLDDDDDDDSSKSRMANATMELTSYIYTINIQLVTRFICMHREGKRTRPRESSSSSLEKNRKENHRVETKFFNSVLLPFHIVHHDRNDGSIFRGDFSLLPPPNCQTNKYFNRLKRESFSLTRAGN